MVQPIRDGNGGTGGAPYKPPAGKSPISGSPGLLTSTGGITGSKFQVLMPLFDSVFNKTYLCLIDGDNQNCEEPTTYFYPTEDIMPNRKVSVHLIMLTYREIGASIFTVGVETYIRETDSFIHKEVKVIIKPGKGDNNLTFPDNKLHTKKIDLIITGERPQPYIKSDASNGAYAITRLLMVGKADEKDLM